MLGKGALRTGHALKTRWRVNAMRIRPARGALSGHPSKQLRCSERVPVGMQLRCKPRHLLTRCA